jgi:hypothetical protein
MEVGADGEQEELTVSRSLSVGTKDRAINDQSSNRTVIT